MKIDEKDQFDIRVLEDGVVIHEQEIPDPLIHTKTIFKGWKSAWKVLWNGITLVVHVGCSREASHVIFSGDYSPPPTGSEVVMALNKIG